MFFPGYELDPGTGRYVRHDVGNPALAGDIVLVPGELADIADGGNLQDILSSARELAVRQSGPTADADLIRALWSLREISGVLVIRWRSLAGFHRFAPLIEEAWKSATESAFIHYISTDEKPICWGSGLDDPFHDRFARN